MNVAERFPDLVWVSKCMDCLSIASTFDHLYYNEIDAINMFSSQKNVKMLLNKRCSKLDNSFKQDPLFKEGLLGDLKTMFYCKENDEVLIEAYQLFSSPIKNDSVEEELTNHNMIIGSNPSMLHILLALESFHRDMSRAIFDALKKKCFLSKELVKLFHQPLGLKYLFTDFSQLEETFQMFVDVLRSTDDDAIHDEIYAVLPLLTSPSALRNMNSSCSVSTEEFSKSFVELLRSMVENKSSIKVLSCLVSCIPNLGLTYDEMMQINLILCELLDASINEVNHIQTFAFVYDYLLINSPAYVSTAENITKYTKLLRKKFKLPQYEIGYWANNGHHFDALVNLITISTQFNKSVDAIWLKCVTESVASDYTRSSTVESKELLLTDLAFLIIVYRREILYPAQLLPSEQRSVKQKQCLQLFKKCISSHTFKLLGDNLLQHYAYIFLCERMFPAFHEMLNCMLSGSPFPSDMKSLCAWLVFQVLNSPYLKVENAKAMMELLLHDVSRTLHSTCGSLALEGCLASSIDVVQMLSHADLNHFKGNAVFFDTLFNSIRRSLADDSAPANMIATQQEHSLSSVFELQKAYYALARLAFASRQDKRIQVNMLLEMRQQLLYSRNVQYQAVGILGVVCLIEFLCKHCHLQPKNIRVSASNSKAAPPPPPLSQRNENMELADDVLASQAVHAVDTRPSSCTTTTTKSLRVSETSRDTSLSLHCDGAGDGIRPGEQDDGGALEIQDEVVASILTQLEREEEENPYHNDSKCRDHTTAGENAPPPPQHHHQQQKQQPHKLLLQLVGLVEHSMKPLSRRPLRPANQHASCSVDLDMSAEGTVELDVISASQLYQFWLHHLWLLLRRLVAWLAESTLEGGHRKAVRYLEVRRFVKWISARVMRDLQAQFIRDYEEEATEGEGSKFAQFFGLHAKGSCEIALNFHKPWADWKAVNQGKEVKPVNDQYTKQTRIYCPTVLPQFVNVLAAAEYLSSSNLININALLGCPLILKREVVGEGLHPVILLNAINWFVALVNTFAENALQNGLKSMSLLRKRKGSRAHLAQLTSVCVARRLNLVGVLRQWLRTSVHQLARDSHAANDQLPPPAQRSHEELLLPMVVTSLMTTPHTTTEHPRSSYHLSATDQAQWHPLTLWRKSNPQTTQHLKRKADGGAANKKAKSGAKKTKKTANETEADEEENSHSEEDPSVEEIGQSKMTAKVNNRKRNYIYLEPGLLELSACLLEVDLSAIVFGLRLLSPQVKLGQYAVEAFKEQSGGAEKYLLADIHIDLQQTMSNSVVNVNDPLPPLSWITTLWLLEELRRKLTVLQLQQPKKCNMLKLHMEHSKLLSMEKSTRLQLFSECVPGVHKVIATCMEHFSGEAAATQDHVVDDNLSYFQWLCHLFCVAMVSMERLLSPLPGRVSGLATGPFGVERAASTGSAVDAFVTGNAEALGRHLADKEEAETAGDGESASSVVVDIPPVEMRCAVLLPPSDALKEVTLAKVLQSEEFNQDAAMLNLKSVYSWLLNVPPQGLPHLPAAYIYCRLLFRLAKYLVSSPLCQSDNIGLDLEKCTESFLNMDWNMSFHFEDISSTGSLGLLVKYHLESRSSFDRSSIAIVKLCDSLQFYADFINRHLMPALRRHLQDNDRSSFDETTDDDDFMAGDCAPTLTTLNRATLSIYVKQVLEALTNHAKQLASLGLSGEQRSAHGLRLLKQWAGNVHLLSELCTAVSKPRGPCAAASTLFSLLMRSGKAFLHHFNRAAFTLCNALFKQHSVEVTTCLRSIQQLTRFLQRMCNHAKVHGNLPSVTSQIPNTKRYLETFVYNVKLIMSENHCTRAFWLGNLKNRDLMGTELRDSTASTATPRQSSSGRPTSTSLATTTTRTSSRSRTTTATTYNDQASSEEDEDEEEEEAASLSSITSSSQ